MASSNGGVDTGLVSVTSFGTGGVNLVKNPLEMADNELLLAQNVEPYREQGVAGIRKRPGLQKITSNGAVSGVIGMLSIQAPTGNNPDSGSSTFIIPYAYNSGLVSTSGGAVGTTYSAQALAFGDGTLLPNAKYTLNAAWEFLGAFPACWCPLTSCYVIGGHAPGQILVSTSQNNFKGVTIFGASVTNDDTMVLPYPYYDYNGKEWAVIVTVAGTAGQVTLYSPLTGDVIPLPTLSGNPIPMGCVGYGVDSNHWYLWVAAGSAISTIRPGIDAAWTNNTVAGAGETLLGLVGPIQGACMLTGTKQSGTSGPRVLRCQTSTTGTCSFTNAVSWTSGGGPLYAFGPFLVAGRPYVVAWGGNGATLGGADALAADVVDSRHIIVALATISGTFGWRAAYPFGEDIQADVNGFNGSTNRIAGPILGFLGRGWGVWYGQSVSGATSMSVAVNQGGSAWFYPTGPQTLTSSVTYPLMVW